MECPRISITEHNPGNTNIHLASLRQSNRLPSMIDSAHDHLSTQMVCTSTSQWKYRRVEWRRCTRRNKDRQTVCRILQCTMIEWLMSPAPCQWWLIVWPLRLLESRQPRILPRTMLARTGDLPFSRQNCLAMDPTWLCNLASSLD